MLAAVALAGALGALALVLLTRPETAVVDPGTVDEVGTVLPDGPGAEGAAGATGASGGAGGSGGSGGSGGAGAGAPAPGGPPGTPGPGAGAAAGSGPGQELVVAVAGQVARPGVVRLPPGSRVVDAVAAAGGVAPGGDPGLLNLARPLVDGEQVLVGVEAPATAAPGTPGAGPGAAGPPSAVAPDGRLDLNLATADDLDRLPGVGPVLAERVLAHRARTGRFDSVAALREVDGIGERRFSELERLVTVR